MKMDRFINHTYNPGEGKRNCGDSRSSEGRREPNKFEHDELCEAIDPESRVVGGEELEMIGGLGGSKLSIGGVSHEGARRRTISQSGTTGDDKNKGQEDEGIELSEVRYLAIARRFSWDTAM